MSLGFKRLNKVSAGTLGSLPWSTLRELPFYIEYTNILHVTPNKIRKANWIGHILSRNCFLKHVTEGKDKGEVKIKCHLDATEVFIAVLTACSTCFGHHYAHHQELNSIIQWLLPVVFGAVLGIVMPETCSASNRNCNKNLCCI